MKGHWIEQVIGWSHIAFHPLKQSLVLEHCGWKNNVVTELLVTIEHIYLKQKLQMCSFFQKKI